MSHLIRAVVREVQKPGGLPARTDFGGYSRQVHEPASARTKKFALSDQSNPTIVVGLKRGLRPSAPAAGCNRHDRFETLIWHINLKLRSRRVAVWR